MAAARHVELFLARVLDLHRPARGQRQRAADIFQQHLLLAAESAADARLDHVHAAHRNLQNHRHLAAAMVRHLRAGADHQAIVGIQPADGDVRLDAGSAAGAACGIRARRRSRPRGSLPPRCRSRAECSRRCCARGRRFWWNPARRGSRARPAPWPAPCPARRAELRTPLRSAAAPARRWRGSPPPRRPRGRPRTAPWNPAGRCRKAKARATPVRRWCAARAAHPYKSGRHARRAAPWPCWCRCARMRAWACGLGRILP